MGMLRSMDSAVSGLRNHQVRMDVIGNNIANVNTVGFKAGRVTFEESLSQMLQGATRPPGDLGGKNPMQVGLGMNVGSIDTKFSQGNMESTGQVTDLAIEGEAFFAVSNGSNTYYTRNGAFQLDAEGKLVLPTNGFNLQGKIADQNGTFPAGSVIDDIKIPFNEQSPAKATEEVSFGKNLDSDSQAMGTVHYSQSFLHYTEPSDSLQSLSNSNGTELGMREGDVLTFSATHPVTGNQVSSTFTVTDTSTMQDLASAMQNFFTGTGGLGLGNTNVELVTLAEDTISGNNFRGAISIFGNNSIIQDFQVTSDNPQGGEVIKSFAVPSTIAAGAAKGAYMTDFLRAPAGASDALAEVYSASGKNLGMQNGDEIIVNGNINDQNVNSTSPIIFNNGSGGGTATTMGDILQAIKDTFRLPLNDGTPQNNFSVEINGGVGDNIPDGALVVRGIPGLDFSLQNISVRAIDSNGVNPKPTNFKANMSFVELQAARDANIYDTSITVFDESGANHILNMQFIPTVEPGLWDWRISLGGDEIPLSGTQGEIVFDQDGTVASFTFDNNDAEFAFDPNNGSDEVRINLDVGGPGNFQGLTQFRAPTTATITKQDGFTTGELKEISIGEDGVVRGIFSNGVLKPLAQIMVVDFINPGGLVKVNDSVYSESANSGDAVFVSAGNGQRSSIKPGALEISNVELAYEFTEMISTQRGYQANARGITVSDSLLEELVNLKR